MGMFFIIISLITIANLLDRCFGFLLRCSEKGVYIFWIFWGIWMAIVTVPMLGYSIFSLQYLYEVYNSGWLDELNYLSPEFVSAAKQATFACFGIFILSVI